VQRHHANWWLAVSAYIILSLVAIGGELEDPFGQDVNDLPLDSYCHQIAQELEIITATPPPKPEDFCKSSENLVMYPLSLDGYVSWQQRSIDDIRDALKAKVIVRHPCPSVKAVNSEQASTTCV
jgi:ion channel-forming bestrophin family protein